MSTKKVAVVFRNRVEDFDPKTGNKVVTPAGTKAHLTESEYERVRHAVRVVDSGPGVATNGEQAEIGR